MPAVVSHLRQRWEDLFGARFEVLLYDLTSTYFRAIRFLRSLTSASSVTAGINAPTVCKSSSD